MSKRHKLHKLHKQNNLGQNMQETDNIEQPTENFSSQPEATHETAPLEQEIPVEADEKAEKDLTEELNDLKDSNLRLLAEFDNFRKRTSKEKAELIKTAASAVLVEMLPLIDDFERARQSLETTNDILAVKEGVDLIYQKFVKFLTQSGIKEIPTENEDFNTEFHEAVTLFPAPAPEQKGKIIDCISKGYTLNDKVIRFAKVIVGE
ncbi:MAG: nucleotide exchange factor GrpE [Prevotellaceae bacterium]|jgi:molecular chaperone GrpE|nr:nucleotide exchange factor GrpE [Prevotellaceae bacterium]